jgi:hypothetical protein
MAFQIKSGPAKAAAIAITSVLWVFAAVAGLAWLATLGFWYVADPGCDCVSQKILIARMKWEQLNFPLQLGAAALSLLGIFLIFRFASIRVLLSLTVGLISAIFGWLGFGLVEASLPSTYYFPVSVDKLVPFQYTEIAMSVLDPMFTWKFLASMAVFFPSSAIAAFWLHRKSQSDLQQLQTN